MQSTVTGKNQVSIPASLARRHAIRPGCRLLWVETDDPAILEVRVLADPKVAVAALRGAGRKYLRPGQDVIDELIAERIADDTEPLR